jgi:hypothetical protein
MVSDVIVGDAVIHGIPSNGSAIILTGYTNFLMDKAEAEHMFESYFTKDSQGNDAGGTAFNEHADVIVDFTVTGSTRSAAAAGLVFVSPFAVMSLANFQVNGQFLSSSQNIFNQTMLYVGGARITLSQMVAGKITGLKMRVWANAAQNALMTTLVIG